MIRSSEYGRQETALLESLNESTVIEKTEHPTPEMLREGARLTPISDNDIVIVDRSPKGRSFLFLKISNAFSLPNFYPGGKSRS